MSRSRSRAAVAAVSSTRKGLSGEALLKKIRTCFEEIPDPRRSASVKVPIGDALMSAFAIFSMKFPSLLQFEQQARGESKDEAFESNLKTLYGISQIPSDTQMRAILDEVYPETIRPAFNDLFEELQRGGGLKEFEFYRGHYLLSLDGTGYFSSSAVHCESCMRKSHRTKRKLRPLLQQKSQQRRRQRKPLEKLSVPKSPPSTRFTYYHQMLAGSLVHPDREVVIPFCPEPILKQDGKEKNDCERNAARRFLIKFREDHPQLKVIVVQDAIAASVPHIQDLKACQMSFILGVKPGSHESLFKGIELQEGLGLVKHWEFTESIGEKIKKKRTHRFRWANEVLLNQTDVNLTVNFLEYWEETRWIDRKGRVRQTNAHFSWVTDIGISRDNLMLLMRGGRARWKIENETFNTLKNQGYEFEHNFGHGYRHLTTVFAYIMMLVFLFDQLQQSSCSLFQDALKRCWSKRTVLWDYFRSLYKMAVAPNWTIFLEAIAYPKKWKLVPDTS